MKCDYISLDNFEFRMYEENVLSSISKAIGLQDIQIGDSEFDNKFMLKGSSEPRVKELLASAILKEQILLISEFHLNIRSYTTWFPKNEDNAWEIYYEEHGRLKDKKRITQLFTVFCLFIDRLEEIKSVKLHYI
jgi:hypothetical protein